MNIENPFVNCTHLLIDFFIETGRYTNNGNIPRNERIYVKIVQIKKLKMKLTFSLDV